MRDNSANASYRAGIFFVSLIYAFLLANYIPMDGSIKDRLNYLTYAGDSELIILRYLSRGFISFFTNEPIWLLTNIALGQFFEPAATLKIIIFFTIFVTSYLVLKVSPKYFIFLLFLLVFPQVVSKFVVHVRQGFAISIFLLGWLSHSKSWRWFLFALTPFIHASFFFVLFLYGLTWFLKQLKFALGLRTIVTILLGLLIGLGLEFIVGILGARQANEYEFSATDVSGLGFLFWLGVFFLYWLQGREFSKEHAFVMVAVAFYLSTYFLIEVTARIFESMLIVILLASLDLTSWRRKIFVAAITAFVGLSWLLRISQPWVGWGMEF